jgi:hypothetical protein
LEQSDRSLVEDLFLKRWAATLYEYWN